MSYVLRVYFDTQLSIAESKRKIVYNIRAFFIGHGENIEARYTISKGILPKLLIQEMYDSYKHRVIVRSRTDKRCSNNETKRVDTKCNFIGHARTTWKCTSDVPEFGHR